MRGNTTSIVEVGPYVLASVAFLSLIVNVLIARKTAERTELTAHFQADVCAPVYENLSDLKRELVELTTQLIGHSGEGRYADARQLLDMRRIRVIGPVLSELSKRIASAVEMYANDGNGCCLAFLKQRTSKKRLRSAVGALEEESVDRLWKALEELGHQLDEEKQDNLDCTDIIAARIELDNAARGVVNELRRQFIGRQALFPRRH